MAKEYWLSTSEKNSLRSYNWWLFRGVNKSLRLWEISESIKEHIKNISAALKKLPVYKWEVYRWTKMTDELYNEVYWSVKKWDIITEKWFTSSSANSNYADHYSDTFWTPNTKSIHIKITSKNWKFSLNWSEEEILFNHWTKFKVTDKTENWADVFISLEEI